MRILFVLSLIIFTLVSPSLSGQTDSLRWSEWRNTVSESGLDTSDVELDSAGISRKIYEIVYGIRPYRLAYWKIPEKIDSAGLNRMAKKILTGNRQWVAELKLAEPTFTTYQLLKNYKNFLSKDSVALSKSINEALNIYRWINRIDSDTVVVVNIPSATLHVLLRNGKEILSSAVIVGKPSTPTPIFGAQLTQIITYPYWNVPHSISVKEFLPKIRLNPEEVLDEMRMQVLDSKGRVVDPEFIDWMSLSAGHFPYRLRQSTGCDNALGVIKFNINSPYDVYLHDTNNRELFKRSYRFLSHGCVRVGKPVELANILLKTPKFKNDILKSKEVNLPSKVFTLPTLIPVVVTYCLVDVDSSGMINSYPDIYKFRK